MNNIKSAIRVSSRLLLEVDRQFSVAFDLNHAVCPDGYGTAYLQGKYDAAVNYVYTAVAKRMDVDRDQLEREHIADGYIRLNRMLDVIYAKIAKRNSTIIEGELA